MSNQTHPIPYQDRVIVTRKKAETVSPGGIIIPEVAVNDHQSEGTVIAIGPQVGRSHPDSKITWTTAKSDSYPKPGDYVQFGQYAGSEIEYNGEKFLIMRESDIMCKL